LLSFASIGASSRAIGLGRRCRRAKVKVQDLLYKNEFDVIYYKVLKVSHGGGIIEYITTKREIYC